MTQAEELRMLRLQEKANASGGGASPPSDESDRVPLSLFGLPLGSIAAPDKRKSWGQTLTNSFTKEDPGSKTLSQSLGFLGGATRTAARELINRVSSLGQEGAGAEDWKRTLKGDAPPTSEILKRHGYEGLIPSAVGMVTDAAADPLASVMAGAQLEKPLAQSAWSAMKMQANAANPLAPLGPVAAGLRGAGRRVFRLPFSGVDAEIATKYKGSLARPSIPGVLEEVADGRPSNWQGGMEMTSPPVAADNPDRLYSDWLWNNGQPKTGGFSKPNAEIGQDLTRLKNEAGVKLGDMRSAEGLPDINLAPDLRKNAMDAQMEKLGLGGDPDQAASQLLAIIGKGGKTPEVKDELQWVSDSLRGSKSEREAAISLMKESAPALADVIERNGRNLAFSQERDAALGSLDAILSDLGEGARSVSDTAKLATSYRHAAQGSSAFQGNQYQKGARYNEGKLADKATGESIADIADHAVVDTTGNAPEYNATKRDYALAARGEVPGIRAVKKAIERQPLSKLDMLMMLARPDKLAAWAGAKAGQTLETSPRIATGTGMALNKLGSTSLWDTILRQKMMQSMGGKRE